MDDVECANCGADLPDATDQLCADCSYRAAAPCCPDPECGGQPCTFPGYAENH